MLRQQLCLAYGQKFTFWEDAWLGFIYTYWFSLSSTKVNLFLKQCLQDLQLTQFFHQTYQLMLAEVSLKGLVKVAPNWVNILESCRTIYIFSYDFKIFWYGSLLKMRGIFCPYLIWDIAKWWNLTIWFIASVVIPVANKLEVNLLDWNVNYRISSYSCRGNYFFLNS